jgi:hypothetical protein
MKFKSIKLAITTLILFCFSAAMAQKPQNWTKDQLMEPVVLQQKMSAETAQPLIFSIGPSALIPGSVDIGMVTKPEKLDSLKKALSDVPKNKEIVVYCGCCPFDRCPNVRPAIDLLNEMKFTNYYLLDLPNNIKQDWIDKGFRVVEQ